VPVLCHHLDIVQELATAHKARVEHVVDLHDRERDEDRRCAKVRLRVLVRQGTESQP
jgi:hypothetical protein